MYIFWNKTMLMELDSLSNKRRLIQSTEVGWIAGPGREWQQYYSTGHPWWMVTERNASRKWKCCKTVSKGDDAVKSEVEQGYALDQAMISIFSIFRSKAGVKLTFYWWLILLRCCLSVAATSYTTDYSNAACLLLVDYRYLPSGDPMVRNIRHKKADTCLIFSYIQGQSRIANASTIPVYHEQNLEQTFK